MATYEKLEYSDNCSELIKGVRDKQLADGLNTVFDCSIESLKLFKDNIVELILQFRLQSYPDQLIDKYTFYSQQTHLIKDLNGAFFADPWDDNTIDIFADIYVDGHKQFVNHFEKKVGEIAKDFYKNNPVVNDEKIKNISLQILQFYAQKLSEK